MAYNADYYSPYEDLDKILVSEDAIKRRLKELGKEISAEYEGRELVIIAIINGAIIFVSDLMRQLSIPIQLDCIRVSSYRDESQPARAPEIIDRVRVDVKGLNVLLVDDILDTGNTLSKVADLISQMGPATLKTCVLLNKSGRRITDFKADFVGFDMPDEFAVGYGLDFAENYRQLPCIGVLKPELQNPPEWA